MNYRARLTSIRDVTRFDAPVRRDETGDIELDLDACRELLFAVLETAIRDYVYMRSLAGRDTYSPAERKRIRAITEEGDPAEFFASMWFVDVCHFLGLDAGAIRDLIEYEPFARAS